VSRSVTPLVKTSLPAPISTSKNPGICRGTSLSIKFPLLTSGPVGSRVETFCELLVLSCGTPDGVKPAPIVLSSSEVITTGKSACPTTCSAPPMRSAMSTNSADAVSSVPPATIPAVRAGIAGVVPVAATAAVLPNLTTSEPRASLVSRNPP